ncbi:macrolide ABC transporter ATP-binding protein [bacterium CG_4_10_14_0_2_um_filter_33_32]|nr:MAG: macrolide ABC transporter ATP-binding protein [bacterium CG10_big_fil_rev_8_21_14_0_10_33_18]PIU76607.1 MAG: macrolide ABC transporter ATP-binding protein [bacterium CG06_land_8_20_14_3_00_33_50]PIW81743.1 MAG: macrolide ABC transporter ATP-binding protein [bacterium CG_4_8_14_3_um_filter_33_28]PIY85107.1 MAG: macrolide ABC transporter ATP-binding protein [bacterium CG_4_10_14_0_8_um_filter_33_57]PIZ86458.1 MAG: macrolide ABC transporter ATP-binding protein [bacterium CG_4_10_14_0_2_um_
MQIELNNISETFTSESVQVKALLNINLNINKGDFIAIIGSSGSGKSTLMNIIGALVRPTSGVYKLDGQKVSGMNDKKLANLRKNRIGFVFQNFNLIPRISILSNVELPMVYKRVSKVERRERTLTLLKKVGLEGRSSFRPNQISGGEIQRAAIARALANNPDIILADEPTGNLDSKRGEEIMKIFQDLNKEGITVILVTHDIEKARYANRIIKMKDGSIVGDENVSR